MPSLLSPGFLVASPGLMDPTFRRAVVLLVEHKEAGSLGFVINRVSDVDLNEVAEAVGMKPGDVREHGAVMTGGPVARETGWVLFDPADFSTLPEGTVAVTPGVAVSTSRALLQRLLRGEVGPRHMLLLGYAGWGEGQLDNEIAQGAWIPVDASSNVVFATPVDQRWGEALRSAGIDPARLSVHAPSEA